MAELIELINSIDSWPKAMVICVVLVCGCAVAAFLVWLFFAVLT